MIETGLSLRLENPFPLFIQCCTLTTPILNLLVTRLLKNIKKGFRRRLASHTITSDDSCSLTSLLNRVVLVIFILILLFLSVSVWVYGVRPFNSCVLHSLYSNVIEKGPKSLFRFLDQRSGAGARMHLFVSK